MIHTVPKTTTVANDYHVSYMTPASYTYEHLLYVTAYLDQVCSGVEWLTNSMGRFPSGVVKKAGSGSEDQDEESLLYGKDTTNY